MSRAPAPALLATCGCRAGGNRDTCSSLYLEATEVAHPVTWFQISGRDGAALEDFYKKIFDWKMTTSPDGSMQMVDAEEGGIPGGVGASRDGSHSVTVYANVDDIAAHLKKIQDAGGEVAMPPMELPQGMGWIAGFNDPAGNWVGLWQPGKPPEAPAKASKKSAKKAPAKASKALAKKPAKALAKKPAKASKALAKKPAKPAPKAPAKAKAKAKAKKKPARGKR
jgi:predicted enzyme related to lactoylglutathione lyase